MIERRGLLIAIEGTDGSGKGTQTKLLLEKLKSLDFPYSVYDFPQYKQPSSFFIKEYLNGKFGQLANVGPYQAALFFALDRYSVANKIRQDLQNGKIVIANRYTASNMAHQGSKINHVDERRGFFIWLDNLEFHILKIPRPDISIVLNLDADIAQKLVLSKNKRTYTDKKLDLHEADLQHLRLSKVIYDDLCRLYPKDFNRIDCQRGQKILKPSTIHNLVWQTVEPRIPEKTSKFTEGQSIEIDTATETPLVKDETGKWQITDFGHKLLAEYLTSVDGNVYAFKDSLSPMTIAAAMARLSRRGDDLRITLLDEFINQDLKDQALLQRVITDYGDDSVQQLAGIHIVVENASNLLTKHLEWGRLAAYLEQSTRYIYYDQKRGSGDYKYYTPPELKPTYRQTYQKTMNSIFDTYSHIVHKLAEHIDDNSTIPTSQRDGAYRAAVRAQACDAARAVLPVAVQSTVGIFASGQALEMMIMRLSASQSLEARITSQSILEQARQVIPTFLERADKPDRGAATSAYLAENKSKVVQFSQKFLPNSFSGDITDEVKLVKYWPINELDLTPYLLYDSSNLSLAELTKIADTWPLSRKRLLFKKYVGQRYNRRHKPGRALEQAHYTWDIICDYGIFRDLQRHRMVDDLRWQDLSPRFGFNTPELIEKAGLIDSFHYCFDLSLQLHSYLTANGYNYLAQYATLLGHKMRWTITYNARHAFHFHELRTSPQGHPSYRDLVNKMHLKLSEVHPLIGAAMKFVNSDEDPELTRLAAEKASQYKLSKLNF